MVFEIFDNKTKTFFKDGFIDGFNIKPDAKHTALRQGLYDYYKTYHALSGNYYKYLQKYPNNTVGLSGARGHDFLIRYFSAVSFVQLFIELYIKEILEKINPILIVGVLSRKEEKNFIKYIELNDVSKFIPYSDDRTVPFNIAFSRLLKLIKSDGTIPLNFKISSKYHLFAKNTEMIEHLAGIRNSIFHKGNEIMDKYSFELLFINYIIPFITSLLRLEPRETLLERNLFCEINILNELCNLKLEVNYKDVTKLNEIEINLRHINQLKELGRASFNNQLRMGEELSEEQMIQIEQLYNKNIRLGFQNEARIKQLIFGYYDIYNCPCCGTNSLITQKEITYTIGGKTQVQTVNCLLCTYYLHFELGEPKEFKIMNKEIFVFINCFQKKTSTFKIWVKNISLKLVNFIVRNVLPERIKN